MKNRREKKRDWLKMLVSKSNLKDSTKISDTNEIVLREEDVICTRIGLNEGVMKYLKNIPLEYREHQPIEYYINSYLQETVSYLKDNVKENIVSCAKQCGFTESGARKFADWVDGSNLKNHQPLSLWFERYIENIFNYSLCLGGDMPRYPFVQELDKFNAVQVTRFEEDKEGYPIHETFKLLVKNCTKNTNKVLCTGKENTRFLFHGTDHLSAMSIVEEGIWPCKGRSMQDFSDNTGFYVTHNFDTAKKWALIWSRPAVVVFKDVIDEEHFTKLDLSLSENEWQRIVKYNRSGCLRKLAPDLRQRLRDCDYVFGPSTTDGSKGAREMPNFKTWLPSGYNDVNQSQLCIRSEKMAKDFGKPDRIYSVLFY
uniref:Uncharacterized protein n=1 Tax=Dikerogammarus haemobaphes virus 1 TaxID=2704946 RepID=A0A6G9HDI3_9VIRU|nr:hypothetical protein [Dikerogammarus haemobaphes virus 1]